MALTSFKETFHLKPLLRGRGSLVQARSIKGGSQYAAGGMMAKVVLTWEGHILAFLQEALLRCVYEREIHTLNKEASWLCLLTC